jgi:hypothetical protein
LDGVHASPDDQDRSASHSMSPYTSLPAGAEIGRGRTGQIHIRAFTAPPHPRRCRRLAPTARHR